MPFDPTVRISPMNRSVIMSELIIQSGKLQGKRLVLPAKEMVVGRDDKCDLRIGSALVSRTHCTLKRTDQGIVVTDLQSQNGTYVNDLPISSPTLLCEGDVLRIGSTLFSVPVTYKPKPVVEAPSDDDISQWLTNSGANNSGADTAVIPTYQPTAETPLPPATAADPQGINPVTSAATAKRNVFTDQAAELIRQHWAEIKAKKNDASSAAKSR